VGTIRNLVAAAHDRPPDVASTVRPIVADEVLRFPKQNFTFRSPARPWVRNDSGKIVPEASLVLLRAQPQCTFIVIATEIGDEVDPALSTFTELFKSGIESRVSEVQWLNEAPYTVAGISGTRFYNRAKVGPQTFSYVHWLGKHNGRVYQLSTLGLPADEANIRQTADEMMGRFDILDRTSVVQSAAAKNAITEYTSRRNGFSLKFGTGWRPWTGDETSTAHAEFRAELGDTGAMTAVCLRMPEPCDDFDSVLHAVSSATGLELRSGIVQRVVSDGKREAVIEYVRTSDGTDYRYRRRIVMNGTLLIIVNAWTSNEKDLPEIVRLEDSLTFQPDAGGMTVVMTAAEVDKCGSMYNELGIRYLRQFDKPDVSAKYFQQSVTLKPDDVVIHRNLITAYLEANRPEDARVAVDAAISRFPDQPSLRVRKAKVELALDHPKAAIEQYAELFKSGLQDEDAFEEYVDLLVEHDRLDEALKATEAYREKYPSRSLAVLYASLLGDSEQHEKAINVLKTLSASIEFDAEVTLELARQFNAADRYDDALAAARQLLDHGYETTSAHLALSDALIGKKEYRQAKEHLETTLRTEPGNRRAQNLLRHVSGMLGEGDNSLVRSAIEAVPIPEEVLAGISTTEPADAKLSGAYYVARVSAIQFDRGKDFRRTELRRIKILNRDGIERFSTMRFGFDPLSERLYVNGLTVRDADEKVISTGKTEDYFVLDSADGDSASHDKELHIPVSGLTPGCTIELTVTRRDLSPPDVFPYNQYLLTGSTPVRRAAVVVRGAADAVGDVVSGGVARKTLDGAVSWQVDDPTLYVGESMGLDIERFLPMVVLGDKNGSWKQVGDEYLQLIDSVLNDNRACVELSSKLLEKQSDAGAKLATLVGHVQSGYTYKAIEFGRRARVPQNTADTIRNRYGDCKDHAVLCYQLLRTIGLSPRLALVNTSGPVQASLPSLDQFDHLICVVPEPGGGYRFIDATGKDRDLLGPPAGYLGGKEVLVLSPGGSELVRVPRPKAEDNVIEISRKVSLNSGGDLRVEEILTIRGEHAVYWRGMLRGSNDDDLREIMQNRINSGGIEARVGAVKVTHLDELTHSLGVELTYTVPARFTKLQDGQVGVPPAAWERYWLLPDHTENRRTPFEVVIPITIKLDASFDVPAGAKLVGTAPVPASTNTRFGQSQVSYSGGENRFAWKASMQTTPGEYEASAFTDYSAAMRDFITACEPALHVQSR
jgi:tetratricopeptide (TPR) repeat protein